MAPSRARYSLSTDQAASPPPRILLLDPHTDCVEIVALAGTRERWEDLHQVDGAGMRTATGGRRQHVYGIDPNRVRRLPPGVALVVRAGQWAEIAVSPAAATQA